LHYLLLVKPQFELPSSMVGEGGIVQDVASHELAVRQVREAFTVLGGADFSSRPSQVAGRSGNREYFLKFVRQN
jgi:predicted rRNA methylase YqxC with S4 and FtsJ domains